MEVVVTQNSSQEIDQYDSVKDIIAQELEKWRYNGPEWRILRRIKIAKEAMPKGVVQRIVDEPIDWQKAVDENKNGRYPVW